MQRDSAKVLGLSTGSKKEGKETWWWNKEAQQAILQKKEAWKKWYKGKDVWSEQQYMGTKKKAKRAVAAAKQEAYENIYRKPDTKEGEKTVCRVAKQRDRTAKDAQQVRMVKDEGEECQRGAEKVEGLL